LPNAAFARFSAASRRRQIADMLGVLIRRQGDDKPPAGRTLG
jgi:hypothetical protein